MSAQSGQAVTSSHSPGELKYFQGKRVDELPENPGEYFGPTGKYTNGVPAVFFLKPNARDPNAPRRARSVHYVISPPHVFIEELDGSLTIRASLGDTAGASSQSDGWHGYLTKGVWEKV